MFLYRAGLVVMASVAALAAAVLLTDIEDRIAAALCRMAGYTTDTVSGDGTCGFNADMQAVAILAAIFLLGLLMTGIGGLIRRRTTARRRMFGPRS